MFAFLRVLSSVIYLAGFIASSALAQENDAGIQLKAANPDQGPAELIREPPALEAPLVEPLTADVAPAETAPVEPAPAVPDEKPEPPEEKPQAVSMTAKLKVALRASYGGVTEFPLDSAFTAAQVAPLTTRLRLSPEIALGKFALIMEADGVTGALFGVPSSSVVGDRVPFPMVRPVELRKFFLQYTWETGVFRIGHQTSHWGLGLLANAGANDPEAGDFGQQQFGNLTWRALLAARPFFNLGGAWRAIETVFAADYIVRDNFAELARGDQTWQGVFALRFVKNETNSFGVYAVYRSQRNTEVTDGGKATDVAVIDLAGQWELFRRKQTALTGAFEIATINGTTTQARNDVAAVLRARQLGAAGKLKLTMPGGAVMFDVGYASGDQNPADDSIDSFRFDRDFKMGLVLFDHVLAYQSARGSVRASDPDLVGTPPEGADLIGTGGSISGAFYLFPRFKVALADWLDAYAGPMFAWSSGKLTDPFNTRVAGGTARNALNGVPGNYLGTEIDLGVQMRRQLTSWLRLTVTGEGGLFVPGDAFNFPGGGAMGTVMMGRVRATLSL